MAELYRFFNSTPDDVRTYQANDFAQVFGNFLGDGFFDGLGITANNNMTVSVAPGSGMVQGHEYTNTATKVLDLDVADSTQDRIDRVVLRLDRNTENRYIKAFIKKGETGSGAPPELTRNDYIWELSLAQVVITAGKSFIELSQITDERGNHDLCGRVQVARKVGDQINTVDIRDVEARPDRYQEGIAQFYVSGRDHPDIFRGWLNSIGVEPARYERNLSSLRAYVHTIANRTNTGVQTFTLFAWDYQHNYEIYGEWKRANNAIGASVEWGDWVESTFVVERGENENGSYIKYSDGKLECKTSINLGSRISHGSGTYSDPYRSQSATWDFPAVFSEPPYFAGIGLIDSANAQARGNSLVAREVFNTYARFIQCYMLSGTNADAEVIAHLTAIGRWR
ncbi:hypothetical protein HXA35_20390 [Bacillus sp. A301a_S52]|jgi:hypothetical protein|nr:hypothetical protein [Bacillus sp. A301a_S52]MCR6112692.1 hypothetical protein [Bacillus sp. A301a_S52]